MNYKKTIIMLIVVLGLNSCVGVSSNASGYDVTVPLSMINTTVAQNFPQSNQTSYGTLLIHKPTILGKQGSDKLAVGTSFIFSNMLLPNGIKGSVNLSSGIRYNPSNRGLYLASPMIDELKFQNFSLSSYLTQDMRNAIGNIIAKELMKKPIYHMDTIGSSFVRGIGVRNGNLVLTLGL